MRTRLQNSWDECRYMKFAQLTGTLPKSHMFFQFDCYAAIDEERFPVPTGRVFHVLRHYHPGLS
jgi:hypothetical protein